MREGLSGDTYETMSLDWPVSFAGVNERVAAWLRDRLGRMSGALRRVAVEKDRVSGAILAAITSRWPGAELVDAGGLLNPMRRRKDEDELGLIRECVACIEAGYAAARQAIRAGATELDVFESVHGAIVQRAGYQLKVQGDFACGTRAIKEWGTPLRREILPGDLYIMDIYPSFHGYHGDLCRTFAVTEPRDEQYKAWALIQSALQQAEQMVRPGGAAREVWQAIRELVDSHAAVRGSFGHHAGHGVGLDAQEAPWMIPGSDHVFEAGDVIAIEPGCYAEALQGGVRLEHTYLVTENGVDRLSQFPLEL